MANSASQRVNHEPAFLLTAHPWRESSLWVELFSRRYGRVAVLARSARKRQSELRGVLVPFVPISASWYGSQELKTLHRAEWLGGWRQPSGRSLMSGLYANELVYRLTAREDPAPEIYDALAKLMPVVAEGGNHAAELRCFEWQLLTTLGLAPDLSTDALGNTLQAEQYYHLCPEEPLQPWLAKQTVSDGLLIQGHHLTDLKTGEFRSPESMQQALRITRLLLDFYLPQGIRSRQIMQQVQQF